MTRAAVDPGTRLILLRHGRTGWNHDGRIQGQLDSALDDTGRAQAAVAASQLAELDPVAIVSSDLTRAVDTARALAERTGLPVRHDPRLRERCFGQWQGLTAEEAARRYPEEYARWQDSGHGNVGGCGIEDVDDVGKRVCLAVQEAVAAAGAGTVVVATHGGAAKYGAVALLGWPVRVLTGLGSLGNCRWIDLRAHPVRGWRLHGYNLA